MCLLHFIRYETTVPSLVWTQTRAKIIIKAFNDSLNDFGPGQVFLKVTLETLVLHIIGFETQKHSESYKIYKTPVVKLYMTKCDLQQALW